MSNFVWMKSKKGEITPVDPGFVKEAIKQGYEHCDPPTDGKFVDAGAVETESKIPTLEEINVMKKATLIKFANNKGIEIDATATINTIRTIIINTLGIE